MRNFGSDNDRFDDRRLSGSNGGFGGCYGGRGSGGFRIGSVVGGLGVLVGVGLPQALK
ncbi:MAG: hypothetical protein U0528_13145 [Anaerolineae bacterium]